MRKMIFALLAGLLLMGLCITAQADKWEYYVSDDLYYEYGVNKDNEATLLFFHCTTPDFDRNKPVVELDVVIPAEVDGYPVRIVAFHCFNEDYGLGNYRIRSITLPAGVVNIDEFAVPLRSRFRLQNIFVDADNPVYESKDGVLFNKVTKTLVCYPGGRVTDEYAIPEGTLEIAESAFRYAEIGTLHIPDSISEVQYEDLQNGSISCIMLGANVEKFPVGYLSRHLNDIIVAPENPYYSSIDGVLFDKAGTTLLYCPYGKAVAVYDIPEGVTAIADTAFEMPDLDSVKQYVRLPDSFVFENGEARETYFYPLALTDEAMQQIASGLSGKDKKQFTSNYSEVDPAAYKKNADPAQLEAQYPALKEGKKLWICKDIRESMIQRICEILATNGITKENVSADPVLSANENVWSNVYPYTVVSHGVMPKTFPEQIVLMVEKDSMAYYWALQNGIAIQIEE